MANFVQTACLSCSSPIELFDPFEGSMVECPHCKEVFRVASAKPLQLVYAFDVFEEGDLEVPLPK